VNSQCFLIAASLNIREKNSPLENVGIKQKKTDHKPLRHETSHITLKWQEKFSKENFGVKR
ncbi:hypothetical protein, partial [Bartonella henselae]